MKIDDSKRFRRYVKECNSKAYFVPVATACNAQCSFCATIVYDPHVPTAMMRLQEAPSTISLLVSYGVERFEITGGGEPTLFRELKGVISSMRAASKDVVIKLYTNGSQLAQISAIDEVNISRVAWEIEKNQEVMGIRGGSLDLKVVSMKLRDSGVQTLRISVPIISGYVDSLDAVRQLAMKAAGYFDVIVLRPLYPATPNRDLLTDGKPANWWTSAVTDLNLGIEVEVDEVGCFRANQLIIGSDLGAYSSWSLNEHAPGTR